MSLGLGRILQRTLVLALVVWAALCLAREIRRAEYRTRWLAATTAGPMSWQLGSPHDERLRRLLGRAEGQIPRGREVGIVTSEQLPADQAFLVALWAAYLLPRHHVRWHPREAAPDALEYFVTVRTRLPYRGYERIAKSPLGSVYRRRAPSGGAP